MNFKLKTLAATALLALALPALAQSAGDKDTLTKMKTSGKAVLGVRESSSPMAYALGSNEKFVGYHVELCERVLKDIMPSVKLEYSVLTAQNTIPLVQNGTVDIGCGPTTNNKVRQQQVAFALTTYVSQVRMATKVSSGITSFDQLAGKTASASTGTTAVQMLRKLSKTNNIEFPVLLGKDHVDSFLLMESGRADAFVLDDNLLAGIIASNRNPAAFHIVGESLGSEPIALVIRKDDPAFKTAVDNSLRKLMKSGDVEKIYNKWFMSPIPPANTSLNLPMSEALKKLLREPNDNPLEAYADAK